MDLRKAGGIPGYETTFVSRVDLSDDAVAAIQNKLSQVVAEYGGEVVLTEDWGKRKLAYTIGKETRGQYNYFVYSGKGTVVAEIERHLRLNENVLRFLSVNLESEFDPEKFRKFRSDQKANAKRREEEREARREERMAERRGYQEHDSHEAAPSQATFSAEGE